MKKNIVLLAFTSILLGACAQQQPIKPSVPPVAGIAVDDHAKSIQELKQGVSIYFDKNATQVESRYEMYLIAAAQVLKNNPRMSLKVDGHTDSTGSRATNLRVSMNRANSVRMRLIGEYNVNANQLLAAGLGPNYPIADNSTEEGRAKNRRVTLTLQSN